MNQLIILYIKSFNLLTCTSILDGMWTVKFGSSLRTYYVKRGMELSRDI